MANKAISELPQAQNVNNQDLFVLEQSGIAKKLAAETFITEQGIIDALAEALDGHGGISSVTLQSLSGRIRTYRITFTDGSATTFQVLDGTTIERIAKTSEAGLVSTYTIFMSDGTTSFFTVSNGADGDVSADTLNDALAKKAPVITETVASTAIATFADGADDMPMQSVLVDIEPVQDLSNGDPSPNNICPISGHTAVNVTRTGKNVFDQATVLSGLGFELQSDGSWLYTGNSYWPVYEQKVWENATGYTGRIAVSLDVKYGTSGKVGLYFKFVYTDGTMESIVGSATGDFVSTSAVSNASKTVDYIMTYFSYNVTDTSTAFKNVQIELGSSATAYEAYNSATATLSWQTEAGTVYKGTIDVATGLLTVNMVSVDFGDLTWTKMDNITGGFSANPSPAMKSPTTYAERQTGFILSCYAADSQISVSDNMNNYKALRYDVGIYIKDTTYQSSTADDFKTAMAGEQLVYELATPQTYQLSEPQLNTLLGNNTVWTDLGDVTVTYPADTKLYIEKLTQPTEDDLVANQAITSGQYFMIGNSLYLALANIASGAAITIGTNAQRVSLADALNTINS